MQLRESAFAMEKTLKSASKVARRRLVAEFLNWLGALALAGTVIACVLVLAAKLAWLPRTPWWGFAAIGLVALIASVIIASRRTWSPERSARELDRSLGLKLVAVEADSLVFTDASGAKYTKTF